LYPELGTKVAQLGTIMLAAPWAHTGIPGRAAKLSSATIAHNG
jgi:hypothetical protein